MNALIFCRKCKANRKMRMVGKKIWECLLCGRSHLADGTGRIFPVSLRKEADAKPVQA